ncbi:Fur family transcriptional regulator [soil metagenome]
MNSQNPPSPDPADPAEFKLSGEFRMTKQRREVYEVLMETRDHPTAAEVYDRTKSRMPTISLATVYNCLETLSKSGLVKQVNMDRHSSRYCPNLAEHAHFYCDRCGSVTDIDPRGKSHLSKAWDLPDGSVIDHAETVIKGLCPPCATAS